MKTFCTYFWQHSVITLLCFSLVACGTVANIVTEAEKYEPIVLNVLTLVCEFTPASPVCTAGEASFTLAWQTFVALWNQYQANFSAGTETVEAYKVLSAALQSLEAQSSQVFAAAHVFDANSQREATALLIGAQTLLAVIEAQFPGPPATVLTVTGMNTAGAAAVRPVPLYSAHLPPGKITNAWARGFFRDYNRNVKLAQKRYSKLNLRKVPGVGFWGPLGTGLGEWKFGG